MGHKESCKEVQSKIEKIQRAVMTDVKENFERLIKNYMSFYEYHEKIQNGEITKKGMFEDDFKFEEKNPDHPLASTCRSERIDAADKLFESLVINKEQISEDQFSKLNESLFDCCASVRLVVAQLLGNIGDEKSLLALEKLVSDEKESQMVTQSATEAIKVLKGEMKVNEGKCIRNEIVYCC
jgi:hypothetical protein